MDAITSIIVLILYGFIGYWMLKIYLFQDERNEILEEINEILEEINDKLNKKEE